MSETERQNVNRALLAFGSVLITQTVAVAWWAATLQANVANHEERLDAIGPRVEVLERDYYRRGGQQ